MLTQVPAQQIENWPIERLIEYPEIARSDGEVVYGHLRLKAARKLGITEIPTILCDEWTPAQVKAFRLMVNRSVTWADWDGELLALELQEIQEADFDLSLTGFDPGEIDGLLAPVLALGGRYGQAHLLAQCPANEPSEGMRLPAGRLEQFLGCGSVGPLQQVEDRGGLTALPGVLPGAPGRFLLRGGLLLRLTLGRRGMRGGGSR
jgi:hypothetical protein